MSTNHRELNDVDSPTVAMEEEGQSEPRPDSISEQDNTETENSTNPDALNSKQKHISDDELKHWKKDFDEYVTQHIRTLGPNSSLITDETYDEMVSVLSTLENVSKQLHGELKKLNLEEKAFIALGKTTEAEEKKKTMVSPEQKISQILAMEKGI